MDRLIEKAVACKLPALAMTDHGNIFGAIKFYNLCMKNGIKPIIGCEVYVTSGSRFDRDYKPNGDSNHHLVLLVKDQQGYANLIKLVSLAHLEGFYYKPRVDKELLSEYSEGLIASSACLKGEIPSAIISGNVSKATKLADDYLNIFGKGNFYLEVMENGLDEQRTVNTRLVRISKDLDIPLVATNDIHYLEKEESFAHEALLAIQTQTTLNDPNRFKFNSDSFYFRTPAEMKEIFKDIPESIRNTIEITQKCNLTMDFSQIHLPHFPLPKEINDDDYLRSICRENLKSRYPKTGKIVIERLEYELDTIKKTGFSSYFLIIWDLVKFAKENHIPVGPGRGCFLPDTKVLMADGRQVDIQNIKAGDYVVSHNGSASKVKNLFVYDIKEDVLTIKAKMPVFDLKLTADHKVLAIRHKMCSVKSMKKTICKPTCLRYCKNKSWKQYKTEWIEASQLKKNNLLLYPKPKTALQSKQHAFDLTDFHLNDTNFRYDSRSVWYTIGTNNIIQKKIKRFIKLDSRMARLFGYYVSEGWGRIRKREAIVGFGFSKAERDKHWEVQRLLKEIFGLDSKIIPHKSRYSCQVAGYSKIVAIFFEMLCGKYAKNKRIPKEIFYSSDKVRVEFLTGVFLGDGSNKEKMRVAYDTISYGLASQIKMLLASLNIMSSIKLRKYKNSKWNNSYKLTISGKQLFYFNRFFKDFKANIKKQAFYRNDTFIDKDYIYFPIQEVSSQKYKGKVYDLSVKKDKTYVANEIAVHNSAAGSIVSYILHITDIDPLSYDLLFERFLNPARVSMPDIDIDFCYEKRGEVLEYVAKKYGKDNVAQIITFGTMLARAVIRDVGRVMSFSYAEVDKIAKMIPYGAGHHIDLRRALSVNPELTDIYDSDSRVKRLIDVAMQLEGLSRHASTHAAGVVISDKPLIDRVPLIRGAEGEAVTGFDMGSLEKTGLLKMDFLGLKTLTVIDETVKIIKRTRGVDLDITTIPLNDRKTFSLLAKGNTIGVFQLESRGMRDILKKINSTKFEDLIAVLALYRPGPLGSGMVDDFINRKQGKKSISYIHPKLESILKKTYGIILYQEQIMQIVAKLAGFDMARADLLRKSIGKKIPEIMEGQRHLFLEGCLKNSIPANKASQIFDLIDYFSGYGFNRSHSAAYALISYRTAYLKSNYPVEFMAALLTSERNNTDKIVEYVNESGRMKIEVLPPDINTSFTNFTVTDGRNIRFGLMAIKNVGKAALENIIETRKKAKFESIFDFSRRVDSRVVNKKVIESLIKSGAMDSFNLLRAQMVALLDRILNKSAKKEDPSQLRLFLAPVDESVPDIEEWPLLQILNFEKSLLGIYLTGHPLSSYSNLVNCLQREKIIRLWEHPRQGDFMICGVVEKVKNITTRRKGERMAILKLEDETASIEVFIFPRLFNECAFYLREKTILVIKGKVEAKDKVPKILASQVIPVEKVADYIKSANISLENNGISLNNLKSVFFDHKGQTPVFFSFKDSKLKGVKVKTGSKFCIALNEKALKEIGTAVGGGNLSLTL